MSKLLATVIVENFCSISRFDAKFKRQIVVAINEIMKKVVKMYLGFKPRAILKDASVPYSSMGNLTGVDLSRDHNKLRHLLLSNTNLPKGTYGQTVQ